MTIDDLTWLDQYQKDAVAFMIAKEKSGLMLPTGTGKSIVALSYALMMDKTTLIVTKAGVVNTWFEEKEKFHLKLDMANDYRAGSKVLVVSLDALKYSIEIIDDFEIVIIDEAMMLADTETVRFKNLEKPLKAKKYLHLLAGYPVENKLAEIYYMSLITGDLLGKNQYHFLYTYFTPIKDRTGRVIKFRPKAWAFNTILEKLKPWIFTVDKAEAIGKKIEIDNKVVRFKLSQFQEDFIRGLQEDGEFRFKQGGREYFFEIDSSLTLYSKVMQIISGFIYNNEYVKNDKGRTIVIYDDPVVFEQNPKLDLLVDLAGDKSNFLLWYMYDIEEQILNRFGGQSRLSKIQTDCRGLNLQDAAFAIYYSTPLSGGQFLQSLDRIHRRGFAGDRIISVFLIPDGWFGDSLVTLLTTKQTLTKKFVDGLLSR